ncbi:MAG: GNAT family N-acetyltransferase [Candidatus Babeliales bacterium]
MCTQQFLLTCLLFLNEGTGFNVNQITENCRLFNSGSAVETCNRVLHNGIPTSAEISLIKEQFGKLPFTWATNPADKKTHALLAAHGFTLINTFPAMSVSLTDFTCSPCDNDISIQELTLADPELIEWASILVSSFSNFGHTKHVLKMLHTFQEQLGSKTYTIFLARYNGEPAAAGLVVIHGEIASLHKIGTRPEFRHKGLGYAVTQALLVHAKNRGCKQALLIASPLGRPVYERLGFREYATYTFYRYGKLPE